MAITRRSVKAKAAELPLEETVTVGRRKRTPAVNPVSIKEDDFSSSGGDKE
jgi:hypothetical protein